ncbi:rhomboid-like protein [Streptomyces sp. NPDC020096]
MTSSRTRVPWATAVYAGAVALGAYGIGQLAPERREKLLRAHSTNLDNLRAGRWHTLATSAFLTEEAPSPPYAGLVVAVLGRTEAAWGVRRTAGAFALGHIGASLLVYAGLRAVGTSAETARAIDVGPSYGFNAVMGVRAARIPHPGLRAAAATSLLALGVRPLLRRRRAFVDAGHLAALAIGLAAGAARRRGQGADSPAVPAAGRPGPSLKRSR